MKLLRYLLALSVAVLVGVSCDKESGDNYDPSNAKTVIIRPSNSILVADGKDRMYFSVIADGHDVTHLATFYQVFEYYDEELSSNWFSTSIPGDYKFWATVEGVATEKIQPVEIEAATVELPAAPTDPQKNNTSFVQRTLITKFTGTKCVACPNLIRAMELLDADPDYAGKYVVAACHSYGKGSPINTDSPLSNSFRVSTYPTVWVANKDGVSGGDATGYLDWLKPQIDEALASPAKAGIAVNSLFIEGTDILMATVELKSAQDGDYYLGCWLVEDGLVEAQTGHPGLPELGGKIYHNDVIRIDANKVPGQSKYDYRGKVFTNVSAGTTVTESYKLELESDWVRENCRLIFFVSAQKIIDGDWTITNAISATVATSKPYEYK